MAMPEAAVDEYYAFPFLQDYIWSPWKGGDILSVSQSSGEEVGSDHFLRLGILAFDGLHGPASLFFCKLIHIRR